MNIWFCMYVCMYVCMYEYESATSSISCGAANTSSRLCNSFSIIRNFRFDRFSPATVLPRREALVAGILYVYLHRCFRNTIIPASYLYPQRLLPLSSYTLLGTGLPQKASEALCICILNIEYPADTGQYL